MSKIFTEFLNLGGGHLERASSGFAVGAHKHALIEYALEAAQGSSLVQPAFVATDTRPSTRSSKGTAAFFGFVPQPIA